MKTILLKEFGSNLEQDKGANRAKPDLAIDGHGRKGGGVDLSKYKIIDNATEGVVPPQDMSKQLAAFRSSQSEALAQKCDKDSLQIGIVNEPSLRDRQPEFVIGEQIPDLHGFRQPQVGLKQEKYQHRMIAELKAMGKTNAEIAAITGYTAPTINYVVKQPWCKQFILDEIHRQGGQQVKNFMLSKAMSAAEVIVAGFEDNQLTERKAKVDAAEKLLSRVFGKAEATLTVNKGTDSTKLSNEELAEIAASQSPQPN